MSFFETPQFIQARDQLEQTRLAFLKLLEAISDSDWDRPVQDERWTVKQEMTHVIQVMKAVQGAVDRAVTGRRFSFLSAVPTIARNVINGHLIVPIMAKEATQDSVARAYQEAHEMLLATLEGLPEEAWSRSTSFPRRHRSVEELANRPVEHFDEHMVHIHRVLLMGG